MKKIVILGALSAIARQVARQIVGHDVEMLLVGRSPRRLAELRRDLQLRGSKRVEIFQADLENLEEQRAAYEYARRQLVDFDVLLLAYGALLDPKSAVCDSQWVTRQLTVNFVSAAAALTLFAEHFEKRMEGCLAAITSVAGDRGRPANYVYGSAKGGLALFLQGLRARLHPCGVSVITIKPGPVDTPMTEFFQPRRLLARPESVAAEIVRALERRRPAVLYTPAYWRPLMAGIRALPEPIMRRLQI